MVLQALLGARILKIVTVQVFAGLRVDRVEKYATLEATKRRSYRMPTLD